MITQYKAADPLDPTSQAEYKLLAGGATRTWVGTEDAYNAEKNNIPNNTMICITDDDMDVVADVYSTSETKTNKVWINGKPIYRRVCSYANTITINNLEQMVSIQPVFGNLWTNLYYYDVNNCDTVRINGDTITPTRSGNTTNIPVLYYIFEYTKTTN